MHPILAHEMVLNKAPESRGIGVHCAWNLGPRCKTQTFSKGPSFDFFSNLLTFFLLSLQTYSAFLLPLLPYMGRFVIRPL